MQTLISTLNPAKEEAINMPKKEADPLDKIVIKGAKIHNLKNISKFQLTNNGKSQFAVGKVDEIKLQYDQDVEEFQLPFMQLFNKIHIIKGQNKPKLYGCFPFSNKKQSSVWGNLAYPTFFLPLIDFTIEENELHITINFNSKFQIHNLIKHIKSSNNLATISKD